MLDPIICRNTKLKTSSDINSLELCLDRTKRFDYRSKKSIRLANPYSQWVASETKKTVFINGRIRNEDSNSPIRILPPNTLSENQVSAIKRNLVNPEE